MLLVIRLVVIALVLLAMLRPTRISSSKKPQLATAVIMFDQSLSMTQSSTGQGSRWEDQLETLRRCEPALKKLAEKLEIKIYGYDQQLHPVEFVDGKITFPEKPVGEQTDIGSTVYDAIQRELGKRLACVILMGDGSQTAYDPKIEIHEPGRELDRQGVPLFTIAYGRADDGNQSKDVAVEKMPQDFVTFVKNQLTVSGVVRVNGYVNQDIPVELTVTDSQGKTTKVVSSRVKVRRSGDLATV